eukprot:CAMPEP_0117665662 /NCGR_PEP_ID=MMETSP0804-20121206/9940_1 /TAXON_ID=1074897 /ORGANISM="Tetraselmis astigmatica, Strain CCMP880" /LENGTH=786 /DNA_ID=CAMNT_0005473111 /DNA_START=68 /DNA_END=2428 /DNA_ORIENTATION=-
MPPLTAARLAPTAATRATAAHPPAALVAPRPLRPPSQLSQLDRSCRRASRQPPCRGRLQQFACSASVTTPEAPWWTHQKELWTEIDSEEQFHDLIRQAGKDGKLLIIDFYATWCHACQKVYPILCLVAEDKQLRDRIVFAKLQVDKFKSLVKAQGITMMPVVRCYGAEETMLFQAGVTPRKVKHFRENLNTVLADPTKLYVEDATGVIVPDSEAGSGRRREATKSDNTPAALAALKATLAPAKPVTPGAAGPKNSRATNLAKAVFLGKYKGQYGYGGQIDRLYAEDVAPRLSYDQHYMDYTAAALYCNSVIDASMHELKTNVFGNPHSPAPSSSLTDTKVEGVRERILKHFNADPAEYQCVFTRGATASLKMVGETFPWSPASRFVYLRENHNSVLGQREYALKSGASFQAVDEDWVDTWLYHGGMDSSDLEEDDQNGQAHQSEPTYHLFAFPGEDNFAGVKYPLEWVKAVQSKSTDKKKWKVMLDAAAYVHSNPLDLTATPADFVSISFYKLFGYPTGLGALLIRTENIEMLKKVFWGGGSVALATSADNFHVLKCQPAERLEDGTIAFLDIIALNHGFNYTDMLGGVARIQAHVQCLTDYLYKALKSMKHSNGNPMAVIFGKHDHPDKEKVQGGIVNFEVLGADGGVLSYREIQQAAGEAGFHLRTGAECNPGACYKYLGLQDAEVETLAGTKEGCNDDVEYITVQRPSDISSLGQKVTSAEILAAIEQSKVPLGHIGEVAMKWIKVPLGSIRVSLGYMSTFEDVYALVTWLEERYKDRTCSEL